MSGSVTLYESSGGVAGFGGFRAGAAAADIRGNGSGQLDVAIIHSVHPCTWAGTFTLNDVRAAPVRLCQHLLAAGGPAHAIVVNSGNANACTGPQGEQDAFAMAETAAYSLRRVPHESVLVASTGRIGRRLPRERLLRGIAAAAQDCEETEAASSRAAMAILTSDTRPKRVRVEVRPTADGPSFQIGGMAKGAGMIEPHMATMLAFLTSDAAASREWLGQRLRAAVEETFNRISVDGDVSTNDTVLLLANGTSGLDVSTNLRDGLLFEEALHKACDRLARMIVEDGERVTRCVEVRVEGAPDPEAALRVCRAVGNSLLVKTSWYGGDPNWGRVVHAAGYAGVGLREERLDMHYDDTAVLIQGQPREELLPQWRRIVAQPSFTIRLNLNLGPGQARLLASDLSEAYVDFNKSE